MNGPAGLGEFLIFYDDVDGAGGFTGNIEMRGVYSPGKSPAQVSFETLLLGPSSVLLMELGGTDPGTGYDQLLISAGLALDGTLDVSLINGFVPSAGDSFRLFNVSGQLSGQFDAVSLPPGVNWDLSGLYTGGEIRVQQWAGEIPEPATLALLALGGLALARRRAARRSESCL